MIVRPRASGFQAGVDIKELAADPTHRSLIGVNRGCAETFAAVYDCPVPVIAAVNGFCLGGGIGIAGNADILIASDDATFGVPEVDRGALGTATHLARLVPQHKVRAMFFTGQMVTAAELLAFGTCERVVPRAELLDTALEIANGIAAKSPLVIRRAKESLNGIEPVDVKQRVPVRAGLHVRGEPVRRQRRAAPGLRRQARRGPVQTPEPQTCAYEPASRSEASGRPRLLHPRHGAASSDSESATVKAVIFDLGGVVFGSPFEHFDEYERDHGAPGGVRARVIARSSVDGAWAALERGELTMPEFFAALDAEAAAAGHTIDAAEIMAMVGTRHRRAPEMIAAIDTHPRPRAADRGAHEQLGPT